ncbi:MAG TPA: hypothetical protein VLE53_02265 [Gemmatimonadaceae bacterium]|nr:hypothetical protein [Gemmatimonadaceae bacterium]
MRAWLLVSIVRLGAVAFLVAACARAPMAGPLLGVPTTRGLPPSELAPGHWRLIFRWQYRERVFSARGDGVARVATPDSLRLDLFLDNGTSAGFVILIGDSLSLGAQEGAERYVPPVPLLWAALGRVTMSGRDTVVRVDGDTLRAEIGPDPTWRLAYGREGVVRAERIADGRIEETVERTDSTRILYRQPGAARTLTLSVQNRIRESAFNATIWRR